jgi:hypothetical protein
MHVDTKLLLGRLRIVQCMIGRQMILRNWSRECPARVAHSVLIDLELYYTGSRVLNTNPLKENALCFETLLSIP